MRPPIHFLLGLTFILILKLSTSLTIANLSIILLASFLIDVDHWFIYVRNKLISEHPKNLKDFFGVIKKKDLGVSNAYAWFVEKEVKYFKLSLKQRNQLKKPLMIFHGIEFLVLLIILSQFSKIFIFIIIGVLFHLLVDYIDLIREKEPMYIKISQIVNYFNNKGKKEFY